MTNEPSARAEFRSVSVQSKGRGQFDIQVHYHGDIPSVSVVRSKDQLTWFQQQLNSQFNKTHVFPLAKDYDLIVQGGLGALAVCSVGSSLARSVFHVPNEVLVGLATCVLAVAISLLACRSWALNKQAKPLEHFINLAIKSSGGANAFAALIEEAIRPDWPSRTGTIDLALHDLPHNSSHTEWWYFNSHVTTDAGRKISIFVCFFRVIKHVGFGGAKSYSHAVTWAISDVENEKYYADVVLDSDAPKSMEKIIDNDPMQDPLLERAFREVLSKGNVPLPDRLFSHEPSVSLGSLDIEMEGNTLKKNQRGQYLLEVSHYNLPCGFNLTFNPEKSATRHGDNGVVRGREGDDMFYYCISRCSVTGTITVPPPHARGSTTKKVALEQAPEVLSVTGSGWYDHEFGGKPEAMWGTTTTSSSDRSEDEVKGHAESISTRYAWNWVSAQLEDNTEVTAAVLLNTVTREVMETKAIFIDEDGNRRQFDGMEDKVKFEPMQSDRTQWSSMRTFVNYPTMYKLVIPDFIELTFTATFNDQEFVTFIAKPAFWEGRCDVVGSRGGAPISGLAYIERNGFTPPQTVKSFFKGVGRQVRNSVEKMYPLRPTYEEGVELIASAKTKHYMKGVPLEVIGDTLVAPVRLISDRGGKSWRSYGALACVDCVGGDSRDFSQWLAMPEFLHVGSLIIDDIQDESETRRGGECAHLKYGSALCINAGTAAYFQCEQMLKVPGLDAETLNRCYQLYFAALRGGHAGQALDINGLDYLMDNVVETGDAQVLEERILAIHMLKTAVPAGTLARMGALVGGGTEEQIEAMGLYFESVGIAFQIMDDVLNLRGLYSSEADKLKDGIALKTVGEDISAGKVTMPIAKAMAALDDKKSRARLWKTVLSKPNDCATVAQVIQELEDLGAINDCVKHADRVVREAWDALDSIIPDSFAKMMLRSFGWFVIDRSSGAV